MSSKPSRVGPEATQRSQAQTRAEKTLVTWRILRQRYAEDVASLVDEVQSRGGLTYADIAALEYAEHQVMARVRDRTMDPGVRNAYAAKMASSRRHMRLMIEKMGGGTKVNESLVVVPEGLGIELEEAPPVGKDLVR